MLSDVPCRAQEAIWYQVFVERFRNGDPADDIDGFCLDVAAEVPMGFWRDFRKVVRQVNPDAFLVGEIWYDKWPGDLMDPRPFLQGDMFDAVMNYRWYRPAPGGEGRLPANLNGNLELQLPAQSAADLHKVTSGQQ